MSEIPRKSSKRPRRETIYLGWKNQGRLVARFLLFWGIYHLTLWQAMCVRAYIQLVSSAPDVEPRVPLATFFEAFVRQNGWMVLFAAGFTALLLWHLVSLTHRIVGPIKRAENALYAMIDGKSVRQIEFRDGDLVEEFERAFNAYLAFLYGSSCDTAATGRRTEAVAKSPNPLMTAADICESPLDDQRLATLLRDLQTSPVQPVDGMSET